VDKYCVICSDNVNPKRWALGRHTCLECGEKGAKDVKHCLVPMAKGAYQPIRDPQILKQLNKYANI
jgi:ribosomal protein L37AE/L43A